MKISKLACIVTLLGVTVSGLAFAPHTALAGPPDPSKIEGLFPNLAARLKTFFSTPAGQKLTDGFMLEVEKVAPKNSQTFKRNIEVYQQFWKTESDAAAITRRALNTKLNTKTTTYEDQIAVLKNVKSAKGVSQRNRMIQSLEGEIAKNSRLLRRFDFDLISKGRQDIADLEPFLRGKFKDAISYAGRKKQVERIAALEQKSQEFESALARIRAKKLSAAELLAQERLVLIDYGRYLYQAQYELNSAGTASSEIMNSATQVGTGVPGK